MKIKKRFVGGRESRPGIYIHSNTMCLNAEARDLLNKPRFISVDVEGNTIILKNGTEKDFKVTYAEGHIQSISASIFQSGTFSKIPNRTKIFGIFENGKLVFEIPEEYISG